MTSAITSQVAISTPHIVGVVGSNAGTRRTAALVTSVLVGAREDGANTSIFALDDLKLAWADGTRSDDQVGDTATLLAALQSADGVVLGTPIYRQGVTGILKNLLDLTPRGGYDGPSPALAGKPVAVVATTATRHHFLATNELVAMLTTFFAAYVLPPPLVAAADDFDDSGNLSTPKLWDQAARVGRALVQLSWAVARSDDLSGAQPLH